MDPENKGRAEHVLVHRLSERVKGLAPGCAGQPHRLGVPQRLAYRAELHHDGRRDELVGGARAEEVTGEALRRVVLNGIAHLTLGAHVLLVFQCLPNEQWHNITECLCNISFAHFGPWWWWWWW